MQQKYPVEGLERVILYWLGHSDEKNCSWAYLVEVLKAMGKKSLAHRISKKHLPAGEFSVVSGVCTVICKHIQNNNCLGFALVA